MASEVSICNLSLGHLGDVANLSSLDEQSTQAQLCSRFYPIARNALLEMASWGFATRRSTLAQVNNPSSTWQYAYAIPAGVVNLLSVLPSDASDDYEARFPAPDTPPFPPGYVPVQGPQFYEPQPYTVETDSSGNQIILSNCPNAVLRYTTIVTDANKFSPLFTLALSWLLSSMLAGPILKGDAGAAESKRCYQMFQAVEMQAESSDANQRRIVATPVTPWIAGR